MTDEARILILALRGRDAEVMQQLLGRDGHACRICSGVDDLAAELGADHPDAEVVANDQQDEQVSEVEAEVRQRIAELEAELAATRASIAAE